MSVTEVRCRVISLWSSGANLQIRVYCAYDPDGEVTADKTWVTLQLHSANNSTNVRIVRSYATFYRSPAL